MGEIFRFVKSIVRAIVGLFKRQPDLEVETLFVNETASDVEVWQERTGRETRTLRTTLRRGEVFAATTSSRERWTMVDARTGWTLRTVKRDTKAATGRDAERLRLDQILDPDGGVALVDNEILRNAPMSDRSGNDPGTGAITVTFRNMTPHDLELVRVVDYEEIEAHSFPSLHSVRIECRGVQAWQARTVESNEPARGRVPAGVELGVYLIAGPTNLVIEIENTLIGFENRSLLDAQLVEIDARKREREVAALPPMEHLIVANWRAREWLVRDAATRVVLDHVTSTRSALSREVTAHMPERPADGAPFVQWQVSNSTVHRLDVEYLDHRGLWVTAGLSDLAPGNTGAARVPVNSTVRAREVWTGTVVAMRICTPIEEGGAVPEEFAWEVANRPGAGSDRSEIAASNETHLHVELVDSATGEVIATLAPHESFPVGKPVDVHAAAKARGKVSHQPFTLPYGHQFFLRDRDTGAVIEIGMAQRVQPMMRARSPRLRSLRSGPSRPGRTITLTIDDALGWPVDVAEIDRVGRHLEHGTIVPAQGHAISVEPDRFVQILRHGTGQIVAELYTKAEDVTVALETPSSPTGPPTELAFLNRSMLTLEVRRVGTAETGPPYPETNPSGDGTNVLAPGERCTLATHGGASFVVRDHHSKTLLDAVVAKRIPRMVELTTVHHGSDDGDPPVVRRVDISFADDFPAGLDVDLHRAPPWTELLAQGTSDPVGVRVGQLAAGNTPLTVGGLYRAVAPALGGAVLAERIVTGDDTTWEIRAALLRTVAAADAPLDPGEIAFYGGINYGGGAVVIATSIPDVGRLPGFPGVVGSIRLGPNTAAELTSADHAGGVADFTMDQPTLAGTPIASGRLAGFTIERIANPTAYGITHRSDLVRHHQLDGSEISAYRVTITAPPSVTEIDVWTETVPRVDGLQHDSVPVSITWIGADGQEQTGSISAVDRQRLVPNSFGKVTFTIPGAALACPALEFRTNTMTQGDVLTIRPDATLHERIANLPDGDFHSHVGEAMGKDSETCAHVQQAIQNLARTVQHKVEPTPHGLAHVHDVGPEEMSHPHWQLDIDAGRFSPLTSEDLNAATQHAIALHEHHEVRTLDVFGQIGTFVKQATHVIVHTATAAVKTVQTAADTVAKDVDRTATQVAKDVQSTGANVANDIRTGDWAAAGADLERGTLSVTKDAVTGVVSVGGDVVNGATQLVAEAAEGAEQLAVVTLQLAGELLADGTRALGDAVQFVLSHTGVVGELIGGILHQIEVDIDKAAAWLRSEFHLDDVKQTADEIKNLIADGRAMIDRQVTSAFADLETTVGTLKERALAGLHHLEATPDLATHTQAALPPHHGEAQEKLDWLLSLFAAPAQQPSVSEPSGPYASAESPFDVAGTLTISSGLADLGRDLATTMIDLVADPSRAATDFGDMMGDVVEEIFGFAEDVLGDLFDGLSNTLADFATTPPSLAGVPLVGSLFGIGNAQDAAALLVGLPASVSYRAMTGKPLAASLADNQAWSVTERQAFSLLQVWAGLEAAAFVGFGSSRPDRRSELQVLAIARSVDLIGLACEWIAEHVDDGSPFDGGGDPGDGDATRSALDNAGEMDTIALWIGTVMFVGDVVGDGLVIQRRHKRRGLEIEERMSGEPREKPDTLRDTELKSFYEGVTGILRILAAVASLVFEVSAADQFVKNSPTSPYARYGHLDAVAKFLQEFCGALPDVMSLDTAVQVARRKATTEAAADAIDESLKTPRALLLGASNVALLGRIPGGPLF